VKAKTASLIEMRIDPEAITTRTTLSAIRSAASKTEVTVHSQVRYRDVRNTAIQQLSTMAATATREPGDVKLGRRLQRG